MIVVFFLQVWSSAEPQSNEEELHVRTLYPWRNKGNGVVRVKRDWIIPPIRVLENSKQVPEDLVQVTLSFKDSIPVPICTFEQILLAVIIPPVDAGQ